MPSDNPIRFESIPDALQSYDHWVCWESIIRDDKPTKQPIDPTTGTAASATDSNTWSSLEQARSHFQAADIDGIGFVFTDDDPFVGIDLDECRDPDDGSVAPWASRVVTQLNSYTERSPSGTGFHILLEGSVPGDRKRRGDVEMYDTARYFTVTGDHVTATPKSIGRRPKSLAEFHQEFLEPADDESTDSSDRQNGQAGRGTDPSSPSAKGVALDDQQLLEKARAAANGEDFAALWQGSTAGYDSHSEADMALACHLAFWTGGDQVRMDKLFRQSGLMRNKWDTKHYADGSTYGERTIERAQAKVTDHYDPTASGTSSMSTPDDLLAVIDELKQWLTAQQQQLDELEATLTTLKTHLEESRHDPETDNRDSPPATNDENTDQRSSASDDEGFFEKLRNRQE